MIHHPKQTALHLDSSSEEEIISGDEIIIDPDSAGSDSGEDTPIEVQRTHGRPTSVHTLKSRLSFRELEVQRRSVTPLGIEEHRATKQSRPDTITATPIESEKRRKPQRRVSLVPRMTKTTTLKLEMLEQGKKQLEEEESKEQELRSRRMSRRESVISQPFFEEESPYEREGRSRRLSRKESTMTQPLVEWEG